MDDWNINIKDTSLRDRIILVSLLVLSLVLIVFGFINQERTRETVLVSQAEAQGQAPAAGLSTPELLSGEIEPAPVDGQSLAIPVVAVEKKAPGVGSLFLIATASFIGFVVLMMSAILAILLLIERLHRRRRQAATELQAPPVAETSPE
jgi:uncharacterized integral membrane protein